MGRGRCSFDGELADVVAEGLRPVVDDVVDLAAAPMVDGVGCRLCDIVDVNPRHDPVAGHRGQHAPLREPHEQFVVRDAGAVETPVPQHDSLGVAVLARRQHVAAPSPAAPPACHPHPSAAARDTGRSRPSRRARRSDSRRRRSPTRPRSGAHLRAARRPRGSKRLCSTALRPARSPSAVRAPASAASSTTTPRHRVECRRPPCRCLRRRTRRPPPAARPAAAICVVFDADRVRPMTS